MSSVIIVENLGKRYTLQHKHRENFYSFHEILTNGFTSFTRKLFHPFAPSLNSNEPHICATEDFWALKDISFEVKQGDRIGIVGCNGAGKSTLLKIFSRITEPTIGRVSIKGRVASLLEVGTGFHPDLTGRENIFLNGAILGMSRAEIARKFDEIVDFAEIERFLDTPVKRYSSGMYVRLAFAVAAHLEPEILIVDEVLSVGDAQFQKKCLGKMEEVGGEGRTLLFVSHNMASIQRLCNSAIMLDQGKMVHFGVTDKVIASYLQMGQAPVFCWKRSDDVNMPPAFFHEVVLVDEVEMPISHVETGGCLRALVKFEILSQVKNLQLSVCLLDDYGNQIFGSLPQDSGVPTPTEVGSYKAIVEFPKDLLMPRIYLLKALLWVAETGVIDSVQSIWFHATETASLANSNPGGRTGLIALYCNWTLKKIN